MKKVFVTSLLFLTIFGAQSGVANAWHYGINGSGACQTNGSYKITWHLDNTDENQPLDIKDAKAYQITSVEQQQYTEIASPVSVGDSVPAFGVKTYTQNVEGSKPYTYALLVTADWEGDRKMEQEYGLVTLETPCVQPETVTPVIPVTPDTPVTPIVAVAPATATATPAGSSAVLAATTTKTPQVAVIPAGAVNAGEGSVTNVASVVGVISSSLVAAFGIVLAVKRRILN